MREEELENTENWDFDSAERRPGNSRARAVVSVAFQRRDFDLVAECAEQMGKKLSEFIREAAIERVTRYRQAVSVSSFTGSPGSTVFTERPLPSTGGARTRRYEAGSVVA